MSMSNLYFNSKCSKYCIRNFVLHLASIKSEKVSFYYNDRWLFFLFTNNQVPESDSLNDVKLNHCVYNIVHAYIYNSYIYAHVYKLIGILV